MVVRKFAFNKLIRDKMYDSIVSKGAKIKLTEIKTKSELVFCFKKKLLEEVYEVSTAQTDEDLLEELADCVEVINGFVKNLLLQEKFEDIRKAKNIKRGGFDKPIMVDSIAVSTTSTDPDYYEFFIDYCMKAKEKYPEIHSTSRKDKNTESVF